MFSQLRPAIVSFVCLTLIAGMIYPALVTGIAAVAFDEQANGSIITIQGQPVGSSLIGQSFSDPGYFWSRPSATASAPYNATAGSGSNLGPTNPALVDAVQSRITALHAADPENHVPVPVDLVTASGSGLDPHISLAAAEYQVQRVARVRKISADAVMQLVHKFAEPRTFGVLGEPRVNVLKLNLALDGR